MDPTKTRSTTPATRDNWLILAGNLKDKEHMSFYRKDLTPKQMEDAIKAQYPDRVFDVGHHGSWSYVGVGNYNTPQGVWVYGPPGQQPKTP